MSNVVPEGWSQQALGSVTSVILGQSPSSDTYNADRQGVPFFQGKADFGPKFPTIQYWCTSPTKIAPKNSILFSVRAPVGDINLNFVEACIGRGLASITAEDIQSDFLFQSLIFSKPKFEALGQGSTFEAINGDELKSFILGCPPLPEQKKIASILTSVDEVIENTQKQIDKLQDLKKATMNELLTKGIGHTEFKDSELGRIPVEWEVRKTGEISASIVPGRNKPKLCDGGIPWITISDLQKTYVFSSKLNLGVSKIELSKASGKTIPPQTVIMSVVGEFGLLAIATKEMVINQQLHGFVCKESVLPIYLYFYLVSQKSQMERLATQTTISYMNKNNAESLLVLLPPLHEQQKIASILTSIDTQIEGKQAKVEHTQSLKKSLMQDLLTGKVRVTVN